MLAICLQHEIDHLDGKLFIDHLSKLKRDMVIKKFAKQSTTRRTEAGGPVARWRCASSFSAPPISPSRR